MRCSIATRWIQGAMLCASVALPGCGMLHANTAPGARATIAGTVRAPGGAVGETANREVQAVEIDTGKAYSVTTNNVGDYTLLIPPGNYRVSVTLRGEEVAANKIDPLHVEAGGIKAGVDLDIAPPR